MLMELFFLLRPAIDVIGTLTLVLLCLGATLFTIGVLLKILWKWILGVGVLTTVLIVIYLCTNGFSFLL